MPVPVTWPLVATLNVSTVELSEVFLIVILPVWTVTLSLKFKTIFASLATLGALSAGVEDDNIGLNTSAGIKNAGVGVSPYP